MGTNGLKSLPPAVEIRDDLSFVPIAGYDRLAQAMAGYHDYNQMYFFAQFASGENGLFDRQRAIVTALNEQNAAAGEQAGNNWGATRDQFLAVYDQALAHEKVLATDKATFEKELAELKVWADKERNYTDEEKTLYAQDIERRAAERADKTTRFNDVVAQLDMIKTIRDMVEARGYAGR